MKEANSRMVALAEGLIDWGLDFFVYVPSSHSAPVIRILEARGVKAIMANREEEAVGIAAGISITGKKSTIIMQDNGFGNALTALTTFANSYHVALPIFANTRGGYGEYNSMIHAISEFVPDLIKTSGIKVQSLGISDSPQVWQKSTYALAQLAATQKRPIVGLFESLFPEMETVA